MGLFTILAAIIAVATSAASYMQAKKAEKLAAKQAEEMAAVQISGHNNNRSLYTVYGKALVGSTVVWKKLSGKRVQLPLTGFIVKSAATGTDLTSQDTDTPKRYLYRAVTLCNGPVEDVTKVLVDGESYASARFTQGHRRHFGTAISKGPVTGLHYNRLINYSSFDFAQWDSTKLGKGVAYAMERLYLDKDNPAFQGEPSTQYVVKGRLLYDPRLDTTVTGGSGSHRSNDSATWAYSDNPVLALLDYTTNSEYGRGLAYTNIDLASVIVCANACDVLVDIPERLTNDGSTTVIIYIDGIAVPIQVDDVWDIYREEQDESTNKQKRYRINTAIDGSKELLDNIQQILNVFKGNLVYVNGKYKVTMADVASPVLSITDDDIIGGLTISDGDRSQRMNRATIKFTNENKNYKTDQVSWPEIGTTEYNAYLAEDQNEKLHRTFTIDGCTDFYQAEDTAEFIVRDGRSGLTVGGTFGSRALALEPGDVVALTYDSASYSGKYFRVQTVALNIQTMDVSLTLREYDSSVYTWNANKGNEPLGFSWHEEPVNLSPTSPSIGTVASTVHNQADNTAVIVMTVPFSGVPTEAHRVEVSTSVQNENKYTTVNVSDLPTETSAAITLGRGGVTYDIRVRYIIVDANGTHLPSAYVRTTHAVAALASPIGTKVDGIDEGATATVIYRQDEPPTGTDHNAGDQWFDTNEGNKAYVWSGTNWVSVQDDLVVGAVQPGDTNVNLGVRVGSGSSVFTIDSSGVYLGSETFSSAPFKVSPDGAATATKLTISGTTPTISIGTDTSDTVTLSTASDHRMWVGSSTPESAKFKIHKDGTLTAKGMHLLDGSASAYFGADGFTDLAYSQIATNTQSRVNVFQTSGTYNLTGTGLNALKVNLTTSSSLTITVKASTLFSGLSTGSVTGGPSASTTHAISQIPDNFTLALQKSTSSPTSGFSDLVTQTFTKVITGSTSTTTYLVESTAYAPPGTTNFATQAEVNITNHASVSNLNADGDRVLQNTSTYAIGAVYFRVLLSTTDTSYDANLNSIMNDWPRVLSIKDNGATGFTVVNDDPNNREITQAAGTGDITRVVAGTNLNGGAASGVATLNLNSTITGDHTFSNNLVIEGNLTVQGTTTTVDTDDLNVKDKNITLNYSTGDSSGNANGAGITIQDAVDASTNATILWDSTNDKFDFSHKLTTPSLDVGGNIAVTGTVDGIDIAARDAVLTTTTNTANAALPRAGGTMTGTLTMGSNAISSSGTINSGAITAPSIQSPSGQFYIKRSSDGANALDVYSTGEVVVASNYFYVSASQGAYFSSTVRFRGNITNDTGTNVTVAQPLSVSGAIKISNTTVIDASRQVSATRFILPSTASAAFHYLYTDNTDTGTGGLFIQSGGGSSAYGGGMVLFSHSHASKAGWVTAGISSGSNGKFTVNSAGNATGADVFTVDVSGNTVVSGTINSGAITATTFNATSADTTPAGTAFQNTMRSSTSRVLYLDGNGATSLWQGSGNTAHAAIDTNGTYQSFWANNGAGWQEQMRIYRGYVDVRNPLKINATTVIDASRVFYASSRIEIDGGGSWAYTRLKTGGSVMWDIAANPSDNSNALQFRPSGSGTNATLISTSGNWTINGTINSGSITAAGIAAGSVSSTAGSITSYGALYAGQGGVYTNNVERITNAGNLTNIGTIASGAITSSGKIKTTGGELEFTSHNHQITTGNASNIKLKIGTTGAAGIALMDSANSFALQLYGDSSGWGFLNAEWGSWNLRKAPTGGLYLNNNNTYYINPAATSNLNLVQAQAYKIGTTTVIDANRQIFAKTGTQVGEDGSYGGYGVLGFGGITNGFNRVFGRDDTNDGLFLASATGRGVFVRTNGSGSDTFSFTSSGNFQVASTTVIDASRNLTSIGTYSGFGNMTTRAANVVIDAQSSADGQTVGFRAGYLADASLAGYFRYTTGDAQLYIDNNYPGNNALYSTINFRNKANGGSSLITRLKIHGSSGNVDVTGSNFQMGGTTVIDASRQSTFAKQTINGTVVPNNLALLNIGSTGSGETRAIDIDGSWSAGESKSISFTHGTGASGLVGQIKSTFNNPSSSLSFGRLYHSGDSSVYPLVLTSTSTTAADLNLIGNFTAAQGNFTGTLQAGGVATANAYDNAGYKLLFGGGDADAQANYYIGTNLENVGGNYSKLDLRWHTGIRMGAQADYGGIRFYTTEDLTNKIMSIGEGSTAVRIYTSLQMGSSGTTVIDASRNATFAGLGFTDGFMSFDSSYLATGYSAFTAANGGAQLGLFRSGSSAGGMYIGADSGGFNIYTSSFASKLSLSQTGLLSTDAGYQVNGTTVIDANRNITAGSSISAIGSRSVVLNAQSGIITSQGDAGGWAFGYHAKGSSGTDRGGFGFLGGADSLSYFYIGSAYNSATALRVYPSGAVNVGDSPVIGTDRTITTGTAQRGLIVDRDVGASITLGNDGTFGTTGSGRYTTLGFSGITNGHNRIFALNSSEDGIYICSATSRNVNFRTNGGGANTFSMTAGGDFQVGGTTVIDSSRNLTNIRTITATAAGSSNTYAGVIKTVNTSSDQWGHITLGGGATNNATNNTYMIGRGTSVASREMSFHIPSDGIYGDSTQPKFRFASTGADTLMTITAETGAVFVKGSINSGAISSTGTVLGTDVQGGSGSPTTPIGTVRAYGTSTAYVSASKGSETAFMGVDSSGYAMFGALTNHDAVIRANNVEYLRILTSGNIQIRSGALQMNSTTVIDAARNITANTRLTFSYQGHYFEATPNNISWVSSGGSVRGTIGNLGFDTTLGYRINGNQVIDASKNFSGGTISSGAITVNSIGISTSANLNITNTSSNAFNHSLNAFTPNMTAGEANILVVGRAGSTKNSGYIGYTYSSAGSNDNYLTFGHWGANHLLRLHGDGKLNLQTGYLQLGGQTVIDASRNVTTPNVYLNDTSTRLHEGGGNALRITTSTGYIDIGSQNSSWIHFQGNKPYYFNQPLYMDADLLPYSTAGARNLGGTGFVWNHVYAKGYFIDSNEIINASREIKNVPTIYNSNSGLQAIDLNNSESLIFDTPDGHSALLLSGGTLDTNYHSNTTHFFRGTDLLDFHAKIDTAGITTYADYKVGSTTVIDASRSLTNIASITASGRILTASDVVVGNTSGTAYNELSGGQLYFSDDDLGDKLGYSIGLKRKENINGNYTKLNIDWHTGITLGASPTYGGVRFFDNSVGHYNSTTKLFSVGEGSSNTKCYNSFDIGGSLSMGGVDVISASRQATFTKQIITATIAPSTLAWLNIGSTGSGETRAIDIDGSWSAGESKSISFTHGSAATNLVGQIKSTFNNPSSSLSFGRLYHSGDSSVYPLVLTSTSTTAADLNLIGNFKISGTTVIDASRNATFSINSVSKLTLVASTAANMECFASGTGTPTTNWRIAGASSNIMTLSSSGNLAIAGTLSQNSDRRIKDNIAPITDALSKTCSLQGSTYTRTDEGQDAAKIHAGLIAQDVEAVLPEAVGETNDIKTIDYSGVIALLVESIKELKSEVDDLKNQLSLKEI